MNFFFLFFVLKRNSDEAWCVSKQSVVNINTFMFRCRPFFFSFVVRIYIFIFYILYFIQENYNASEALFQTIIYTFCCVYEISGNLLKYIIVVAQYNMNVLCTLPFFFFCFTRMFHDKVFSNIHYICSNTRLDLKF